MPEDFKALADEILKDLVNTGESFWDNLDEDHRTLMRAAAEDIADATLKLVTDPGNADLHKSTILHAKSQILDEGVLTSLEAASRMRAAVLNALQKLVMFGLSAL